MEEKAYFKGWRFDDKGKSPAFFPLTNQAVINRDMIERLKIFSENHNHINIRLCMQSSPDRELQDMVILEYKNKKCRIPHKHIDSDERIEIIEGKILSLIFDDLGNLLYKDFLSRDGNFVYRNAQNLQHLYFPTTERVIFSETRGGKFVRENLVPAPWDYLDVLKKHLSPEDLKCYNTECRSHCPLWHTDLP